jgi:hypothetical protein
MAELTRQEVFGLDKEPSEIKFVSRHFYNNGNSFIHENHFKFLEHRNIFVAFIKNDRHRIDRGCGSYSVTIFPKRHGFAYRDTLIVDQYGFVVGKNKNQDQDDILFRELDEKSSWMSGYYTGIGNSSINIYTVKNPERIKEIYHKEISFPSYVIKPRERLWELERKWINRVLDGEDDYKLRDKIEEHFVHPSVVAARRKIQLEREKRERKRKLFQIRNKSVSTLKINPLAMAGAAKGINEYELEEK